MTELETIKELKRRIELIDKNYKEEVADYREVLKMAVATLEEIQQYRTLGTVEEIEEIMQIASEGQDYVDESGFCTGLLHTLLEYAKYAKIGTVSECREAVERQRAKKPILNDKANVMFCPICERKVKNNYDLYCSGCGQAIDWSETQNDREGSY